MLKVSLSLLKIILFIIVLFSIGVIFGITGYYLSIKKTPASVIPVPKIEPLQNPTSQIVLETIPVFDIDTSNWKTYMDINNNFSFQYPDNWKLSSSLSENDSENSIISVSITSPEKQNNIGENISELPPNNIVFGYYSSIESYNPNVKSLEDLIAKENMTKIAEMSIDKLVGINFIEHGLWDSYGIFIEKNEHLYEIYFPGIEDKKFITPIEWTILSTFKFTENNETANWKTYRNEKAGFEIKYPNEWGPIATEEFRKSIAGKGEEFYVIFSNNNFIISGNTADFESYENPFSVYLGGDLLEYCKELGKQILYTEECEEINKNIAAVSYSFYLEAGMFGSGKEINFLREAFIKNESNKYTAITFSLRFPEYQNDKLVNMNEDQIRVIAKNQLTKLDKKAIGIFNQIIQSFKFIK